MVTRKTGVQRHDDPMLLMDQLQTGMIITMLLNRSLLSPCYCCFSFYSRCTCIETELLKIKYIIICMWNLQKKYSYFL